VKAILVSSAASNSGKTSFTLGLCHALKKQGLKVQAFKCGPDYLDPTYLKLATGRPAYNLDLYMTGEDYVRSLFYSSCAGRDGEEPADIAVIEGAMGLYDGVGAQSNNASAAAVSKLLGVPVVLVVSARSMAGSFAALVNGFVDFPDAPDFAGVVANFCGSDNHASILRDSLSRISGMPDFLGAIMRGAFIELPSRHLGLVRAEEAGMTDGILDSLANAVSEAIDLDGLLTNAAEMTYGKIIAPAPVKRKLRLGIACDEAFHFYYPDNLQALEDRGVELIEFSPLHDCVLPDNLDGLYLGGGYPEMYAGVLSQNFQMRENVREFCVSGRMVYAECGGLMYLAGSIITLDNSVYKMAGVIPVRVKMLEKINKLGYVCGKSNGGVWAGGVEVRGHEYHYSEVLDPLPEGWCSAYFLTLARDKSAAVTEEGYARGLVQASYLHAHFASSEELLDRFISALERV